MGKIGTPKSGISKKNSPRLQSQKRTIARPLTNPPYCQSHEKWTQRTNVEPKNRILSRLRPLTSNSSDNGLARTLEEYERLLSLPLAKTPHYFYRGHYPSWASMAKVGATKEEEESIWWERLQQLVTEGDWPAFVDAYGLLVYGIFLFPHLEDYIVLMAIDAFLAKRDRGDNPIIAVLANTYYTLNYCCEKNGRILRCCTYLLYLWMTTHLSTTNGRWHAPQKTSNQAGSKPCQS
ncbi:hypothetical protein CR513_58885, partial [Mucuna pruriens]